MRFNQFNGTGLIACLIVGTCDGLDLSSLAWCCDSFASPVRRTTYATNDRMHFITVCDGIAQALQQENARPFTHDEPVGSSIEWSGMAWRKGAYRAEFGKGCRIHCAICCTSKHNIDLTCLKQTARVQNSGHRGCTSSIHGMIWPLQIQEICHSTRHHIG